MPAVDARRQRPDPRLVGDRRGARDGDQPSDGDHRDRHDQRAEPRSDRPREPLEGAAADADGHDADHRQHHARQQQPDQRHQPFGAGLKADMRREDQVARAEEHREHGEPDHQRVPAAMGPLRYGIHFVLLVPAATLEARFCPLAL